MRIKLLTVFFLVCLLCAFFLHYFSQSQNIKGTVVKFSSWGSQSEVEVLKSVINEFEKENPNIHIDFIHIPQNYYQKIHLLFASGLQPDVIFINNQNIPLYINAGLLEDLSSEFPEIENIFFNQAINCFKENEKLYAIPRDLSNLVIYYNKDILKESKIVLPKKINDIYELRDILLKLTNENHFGINYEDNSLYWLYYLASNGGGVIADDKKSIIINKTQSINAINLYSDFINKYHIAPTKAQIGSMTPAQMFINGKLAMYLGGRWMVPKFRETINFDWDIIDFPASSNNKVYIDSSGWAISKKSKNKKAAILFIKYLSSKNTIDKFTKSGLIIPARKDSAYSQIFLNSTEKPHNSIIFLNMLEYAKPTPVIKNYNSVNDILKEEAQKVFDGKKQAEEIFDENVVNRLERLL
ncbi:sugar ABC transporter substrate-binding protein [bacterium]|nr:sugar ABC transporter substrate-binding protein [bacterium]